MTWVPQTGIAVVGALLLAAGCATAAESQPVAVDHDSVVRVGGVACGRLAVGGGVAVGVDRVVTNAHVVAGVEDLEVTLVGSDEPVPGVVEGFDANRDLALVTIEDPVLEPVTVAENVITGDVRLVVVSKDGPVETRDATIDRSIVATGDDIYRREGARRRALELTGTVVAGESGSGLFDAEGDLVGVVFANSSGIDERSYAVAATEVAAFLTEAENEAQAVGPCLSQPPPSPGEGIVGDPTDAGDPAD